MPDCAEQPQGYSERPTLNTYVEPADALLANVAELLETAGSGTIKIEVKRTYA